LAVAVRFSGQIVAGIGVAAIVVAALQSPAASADGQAVLGGGAGIVVDGTYCTLGTIGHDKAGELVGFTAGHCGGPGAQVVAEGSGVPVGTVAAVGDGMDYAVIKFDPAKAIPTANFGGFAINGIGPDPDWHQPACTNGAANGVRCGGIASIPGPGPRSAMNHALFQPGDDGGPVTSNDMLIGLAFGGHVLGADWDRAEIDVTTWVKTSAVLADVNAKGGPGAGFTPIPA
jgi:hypothetical protein